MTIAKTDTSESDLRFLRFFEVCGKLLESVIYIGKASMYKVEDSLLFSNIDNKTITTKIINNGNSFFLIASCLIIFENFRNQITRVSYASWV